MIRQLPLLVAIVVLIAPLVLRANPKNAAMLELHTRSRPPDASANDKIEVVEKTVAWNPRQTALVVVDMWDDHWCQGAARRVAELAGPMNKLIAEARGRGVLIVHCPSTCVDFYQDTPARRRAIEAPCAKPPIKLATSQRWGTAWPKALAAASRTLSRHVDPHHGN